MKSKRYDASAQVAAATEIGRLLCGNNNDQVAVTCINLGVIPLLFVAMREFRFHAILQVLMYISRNTLDDTVIE
jgi:hypothetical protein